MLVFAQGNGTRRSLYSGNRRQRELSREPRLDDRCRAGGLQRREPPIDFLKCPLRASRGKTSAAAATFFSSLFEEKVTPIFVSVGPFKFTSRPRPHSTTANLRARPCLLLDELSLRSIALSWLSMSMSVFQKKYWMTKFASDCIINGKNRWQEAS